MNDTASPTARRTRLSPGALAALVLLGAAVASIALFGPGARRAAAGIDKCSVPADFATLEGALPRVAERLADGKGLTIVALGSSSTYGTGASGPQYAYPSRLAALLQARYPAASIRVLNRGVGGEIARTTMERIARDVVAEHPDLVIWQVGTNDVLQDLDPQSVAPPIRTGVAALRRAGADVILMDLQYAPAVLAHADYHEVEQSLWALSKAVGVPLFHRFALMREWEERGNMTMTAMVAPDHLHMTDTSYDCLARQLSASISHSARG